MSVDTTSAPRFAASDGALTEYFAANGYVVVKSVASGEDVEHATGLLWAFLEEKTHMQRSDNSTWDFPHDLGYADLGIVNSLGFNHSECCWYIRQLPKVRQAFAQIWETDELICSFDGGNIFLPWQADETRKTAAGWFHVDQGRTKGSGLQGVQGLVALTDASRYTGGLLVIPGSHLQHQQLMNRQYDDGDFCGVDEDDGIDISNRRLIVCRAGDLVLWDSRLVHCNTCSLETPSLEIHPLTELLRAAVYVCMCPSSKASESVLNNRRLAFVHAVGTNHWPHEFWPTDRMPSPPKKNKDKVCGEQLLRLLEEAAERRGVSSPNLALIDGELR